MLKKHFKMRILLLLVLPFGVWSVQAQRLRRGLTVESLEVEMQLETMTAEEKKEQIHKALGHHHSVNAETNVEVLETVLETGAYPKPHQNESPKTTEELIEQYLNAEPAGGGHSFLSKGGSTGALNQPGTLSAHGGGKQLGDEKTSKASKEEDDDDEDGPTRKNDEKSSGDGVAANAPAPPTLSPALEEAVSDEADFTAQDNIIGEVSLVTVTMKHAAFLYERTSAEAPSHMDLSHLTFVTNSMLLEMFTHIFTNIISADYISMDISEYTELRADFVDFKVNVYFNGDNESAPDAKQLSEIAMEELSPGSKHYDLYLEWLQQSESPVLSSTIGFIFVSSETEIDMVLTGKAPVEGGPEAEGSPGTGIVDPTSEASDEGKTNHLIPLIVLGLIFVGAAAWFSYRRKAHARRPQRGHNLMKLKGDRDDSTVATYKTAVYTEAALKKAPTGEKGPTMEELDEISIGDSSDSCSSFSPPTSPVSDNGLTAKSMRSIVKGLKKPSWASRSFGGSELSSNDATESVIFATPVSSAAPQDEVPKAPPLKPVTYDFDDTPRSRLPRKKYSKAGVRLMEDDCPHELDIKMHKRPVVDSSSQAVADPSLSIPELKIKDLMVDTSMESPIKQENTEETSQRQQDDTEGRKEANEVSESSASSESLLEEEKEAILFACKALNGGKSVVETPKLAEAPAAGDEKAEKITEDAESTDGTNTPPLVKTLKMKRGSTYVDPSDLPEWMRKFNEMGLDKSID